MHRRNRDAALPDAIRAIVDMCGPMTVHPPLDETRRSAVAAVN
jgi:hypothetical protein